MDCGDWGILLFTVSSLEVGDENLCMRTKGAIAYLYEQTMKVILCERLIDKSLM